MLVPLLLLSFQAPQHIEMAEPVPRYEDQKAGPCGRGDDGGEARTDRVTAYEPGQEIVVRLTETVDHEGSLRVRFDVDGADQDTFDENELAVQTDPQNPSGQVWELPVTLPDVTCERCTLQVVQVMQRTPDPDGDNTYFQCADIVLVEGGGGYLGPSCAATDGGGGALTVAALASLASIGAVRRRGRRRQRM